MSIHQQITALLDGELADAGAVAELMHVLAVSPEKRDLLVEQLSLKRQFASSSSTVVPAVAADLAIMRGLGVVDAGFPGATSAGGVHGDSAAPAPSSIPAPGTHVVPNRLAVAAAAVVLLIGGFGIGYLARGGATASYVATSGASKQRDAALAGARDSIATLERRLVSALATAESSRDSNSQLIAASLAGNRVERVYIDRPFRAPDANIASDARNLSHPAAVSTTVVEDAPENVSATTIALTQLLPPPQQIPRASRVFVGQEVPSTTTTTSTASTSARDATPRPWQLGVRNHFRLSLPRVYGLAQSPTALLDRELVGTYELGDRVDGESSHVRVGAGFGQTQFSMVFHSNTGGAAVDTIFEQSPQAYYGRAFIAPELIRFDAFAGLLEVGGGYSQAGGFGTVGLNVEFRPTSSVAIHAGASSWLLWTSYNGGVNLSTNVNAHVGAMVGF